MKFPALATISILTLASSVNAEGIVLKSGARGEVRASIIPAAARFGGPSSGNMIGLKIKLKPNSKPTPKIDARSVCHQLGQSTYNRMKANGEFRAATADFIDLDAPLAVVRVEFLWDGEKPLSISNILDFDMRGIIKCAPPK